MEFIDLSEEALGYTFRGLLKDPQVKQNPIEDPGLKAKKAEFSADCTVYHLWMQPGGERAEEKVLKLGDPTFVSSLITQASFILERSEAFSSDYKRGYFYLEMMRATKGSSEVGNIGADFTNRAKTFLYPSLDANGEFERRDFITGVSAGPDGILLEEQQGSNQAAETLPSVILSFRIYDLVDINDKFLRNLQDAAADASPAADQNIEVTSGNDTTSRMKSLIRILKKVIPDSLSTFPNAHLIDSNPASENINNQNAVGKLQNNPRDFTAIVPSFFLSVPKEDLTYLRTSKRREKFDKSGKTVSTLRAEDAQKRAAEAERKRKLEEFKKDKESEPALVLGNTIELAKRRRKLRQEKGQIHKNFASFDFREYDTNVRLDDIGSFVSAPRNMAAFFEDLRPIHYSALIPRVRIYKDQVASANKSKNLLEYEFEEYFDITDTGNSAGILKNLYATSNGVNVTSFDWSYTGKDPYQASTIIMVDIKFRAQNIDVLYEPRTFIDKDGKSTEYKFADLMIPGFLNTQDDGVRDEKTSTALRTVVEYSVNESDGIWEGYEDLKNVIKSMRTEMSLYLMNYEIDLQDTGTVVISARYTGRLNSDFEDPKKSALGPLKSIADEKTQFLEKRRSAKVSIPADKKKVEQLQKEIDAAQKGSVAIRNAKNTSADQQKAALLEKQNEKNKLEAGIKEREKKYRLDLTSEDEAFALFAGELRTKRIYRDFTSEILKKIKVSPVNVISKKLSPEKNTDVPTPQESFNISESDAALGEDEDSRQEAQLNLDVIKASLLPTYDNENYYIKYVYFGDLVEQAIASFFKNKLYDPFDVNDVRIALGPVDFIENTYDAGEAPVIVIPPTEREQLREDLVTQYAQEGLSDEEVSARLEEEFGGPDILSLPVSEGEFVNAVKPKMITNKHRINIADIPISVNLLLDHFNDKIVEGGKQNYTLSNFFRDSFLGLIQKQFAVQSEHVILQNQTVEFRQPYFTTTIDSKNKRDVLGFEFDTRDDIKGMNGETGQFAVWRPEPNKGPPVDNLVYLTELKENGKLPVVTHKSNYHEANSSTSYLFIYGSDRGTVTRTNKTKKQDLEDGVYHLKVGAEAGAVKDISLKTASSATYEAMTLQIADNKGEPISRRVYDATVTLHGTPFVIPGQVVYINPAAFGTEKHLKDLGLVGYFLVISVSNSISEGRYETVLECKFTGN